MWAGPSWLASLIRFQKTVTYVLLAFSFSLSFSHLLAHSLTYSLVLSNEASCHVMRELWESPHGKESREVLGQQPMRNWGPQYNRLWRAESCQQPQSELGSAWFPGWAFRWDPGADKLSPDPTYRNRDNMLLFLVAKFKTNLLCNNK